MHILGIIPARGGSKGIPRKNLVEVAGKPLIAYTIEAALTATKLTDVIVSTDDQEIAEVSRRLGAEVPFMRPEELARDDSPTIDVLQHVCSVLANTGRSYDSICLLQPTSPIRPEGLIDRCIEKFIQSSADSLVTVFKIPHQFSPYWVYWKNEEEELELVTGGVEPMTRRQLLPPAYARDGSVYLASTQTILAKKSLYGKQVLGFEVEPTVNIDAEEDLRLARQLLQRGQG